MGRPEYTIMTEAQIVKFERSARLREIAPVIVWLYQRNLCKYSRVDKGSAALAAEKVNARLEKAGRKELQSFVAEQIGMFSMTTKLVNPCAKETNLSSATRRFTLLSNLLIEFSECDSQDVVKIVNAYLDTKPEDTQELLALTIEN